jgi:glycerol uptake facilitator-like aquaporin
MRAAAETTFLARRFEMRRKLLAEFVGMFWLVFGCGSAILAAAFPQLGIGFVGAAGAVLYLIASGKAGFVRAASRRMGTRSIRRAAIR